MNKMKIWKSFPQIVSSNVSWWEHKLVTTNYFTRFSPHHGTHVGFSLEFEFRKHSLNAILTYSTTYTHTYIRQVNEHKLNLSYKLNSNSDAQRMPRHHQHGMQIKIPHSSQFNVRAFFPEPNKSFSCAIISGLTVSQVQGRPHSSKNKKKKNCNFFWTRSLADSNFSIVPSWRGRLTSVTTSSCDINGERKSEVTVRTQKVVLFLEG